MVVDRRAVLLSTEGLWEEFGKQHTRTSRSGLTVVAIQWNKSAAAVLQCPLWNTSPVVTMQDSIWFSCVAHILNAGSYDEQEEVCEKRTR